MAVFHLAAFIFQELLFPLAHFHSIAALLGHLSTTETSLILLVTPVLFLRVKMSVGKSDFWHNFTYNQGARRRKKRGQNFGNTCSETERGRD